MDIPAAEQALERETTVSGLLRAAARAITEVTDAAACAFSRLVGELIVDIANFSRDGRSLLLGYGYVLGDYPLTKRAVEAREVVQCSLLDDDCDEQEAALLRELGYDSLLLLPLERNAGAWGLVEVYTSGRRFDDEEVELARRLVLRTSELLEKVG